MSFKPVSSRVNLPQMETAVLAFWQKKDIFEQSVAQRQGGPRFVFFEGPPTANGSPGIHHVLSRVFKDVILRYRAMKGDYVPRIAGWDTHGLPVELEVERQLGISSKQQIEEYGIAEFNKKCRESVFTYLRDWEKMTARMGYWLDMDHAYVTMDNGYIESAWWALSQMWDRGLIYQGYRVTPHCPRCGTSLSSHEVALGYQEDTEDPSVYIKFKVDTDASPAPAAGRIAELAAGAPVYLLAWTTTPWTLPANTALAVAPDADYAMVKVGDEYIILASARLDFAGLAENETVAGFRGSELVDITYEPLFNPHDYGVERRRFTGQGEGGEIPLQQPDPDLRYRAIGADFVSMEDGTGIVHVAPAYGEADYQAGVDLGLSFVHSVDLDGKVIGSYPFAGYFVKDADPLVLEDLQRRDLLYRSETVKHTYPFCWRCHAPLVYYAKESWYIRTTAVKERLISGNEEINWYPEHIKQGRFGDWLANNVDWAISRERYWGTPLPVWRCGSCGWAEAARGVDALKAKPGLKGLAEPLDLHRPYVDEITYDCPECGGPMRRVPDVIDCWFDSGNMPIAQWHYPFENAAMLEDGRYPADYICEAVDQTRGWFYSLHAISTLLFDRPCYKNVICLGLILDAKGEKMSKAKGNVVAPEVVMDQYGADALRWMFLTGAPPGNVRRFDAKQIQEVQRRFLMTLWNTYSFFVLYANIDNWRPGDGAATAVPAELDRWITSELNWLVREVDVDMANYGPTDAGRKMEGFVDNLSNWYVRRSRRRFWKSDSDADKMAAYATLHHCLVTLAKLMAPFAPFITEEIYSNLMAPVEGAPASVHLADFPLADASLIDDQLNADTRLAMRLSSLGRSVRNRAGIKVRQPLPHVCIKVGRHERDSVSRVETQLLDELNVEEVRLVDSATDLGEDYVVTEEAGYQVAVPTAIPQRLLDEGLAREVVHRLQNLRKGAGFEIADRIHVWYQSDDDVMRVIEQKADFIMKEVLAVARDTGAPPEDAAAETCKLSGHEVTLAVRRVA